MILFSVTPEITAQEYYDRRQKLADSLPPNSVALIPSAVVKYRSGPVFHKFHQDTNFFYLTGWSSPSIIDLRAYVWQVSTNRRHAR
jgi:intermediate cleaving peptidase 55